MTVKDIFDLRKQGKTREAYDAIRPMYAGHKGKYTTLCMFWTACDMMKLCISEKQVHEAERIFEALLRIVPNIDDADGKANTALLNLAIRLSCASEKFSMLDFIEKYRPTEKMREEDWLCTAIPGAEHMRASLGQRMMTRAFRELKLKPTIDNALKIMPLLQVLMKRNPNLKANRRAMAKVYVIMNEKEKAKPFYWSILAYHHDSYIYAELAEITDDLPLKAALLGQAIENQRLEQFKSGYRLELAKALWETDKPHAAYELVKHANFRKAKGFALTCEVCDMLRQIDGIALPDDADQRRYYTIMAMQQGVKRKEPR